MVASFIVITELEALTVATQAWYLCVIAIVLAAIVVVVFVASSAVASARPAFVKPLITSRHFKLPYLVVVIAQLAIVAWFAVAEAKPDYPLQLVIVHLPY